MALEWRGDEAIARVTAGAILGLNKAAEALLADSKALVPVDSGDLRRSGAVVQATMSDPQSAVTYNTPYAVKQHEDLSLHHPPTPNPKAQAKYLEAPARQNADKYSAIVAAEIRREVG